MSLSQFTVSRSTMAANIVIGSLVTIVIQVSLLVTLSLTDGTLTRKVYVLNTLGKAVAVVCVEKDEIVKTLKFSSGTGDAGIRFGAGASTDYLPTAESVEGSSVSL